MSHDGMVMRQETQWRDGEPDVRLHRWAVYGSAETAAKWGTPHDSSGWMTLAAEARAWATKWYPALYQEYVQSRAEPAAAPPSPPPSPPPSKSHYLDADLVALRNEVERTAAALLDIYHQRQSELLLAALAGIVGTAGYLTSLCAGARYERDLYRED